MSTESARAARGLATTQAASLRRAARMARFRRALARLAAWVVVLVMAYPLVWMALSSMKTNREIFSDPWKWPSRAQWGNYVEAWRMANMGRLFLNSLVVTGVSLLVVLLFASLAGYAFARLKFRGREWLLATMVVGLFLPVQVVVIPLFVLLRDLRVLNTPVALILPYVGWHLALSIYLFRSFFVTLPRELEDAARVDGASRFTTYWRILLPTIRPGLIAVAILNGISMWNEFLLALLFIWEPARMTLPPGVLSFYGNHIVDYRLVFSALTMSTLPVLIVYLIFQRRFIEGLTVGATG